MTIRPPAPKFKDIPDRKIDPGRAARSETHLTLGKLCDFLSLHKTKHPSHLVVFDDGHGVGRPQSYAPFPCDLALQTPMRPQSVAVVSDWITSAVNETFLDMRSGEPHKMGPDTPLWMAGTDRPILKIVPDVGAVVLVCQK